MYRLLLMRALALALSDAVDRPSTDRGAVRPEARRRTCRRSWPTPAATSTRRSLPALSGPVARDRAGGVSGVLGTVDHHLRFGADRDVRELDDLAALLGHRPATVAAGLARGRPSRRPARADGRPRRLPGPAPDPRRDARLPAAGGPRRSGPATAGGPMTIVGNPPEPSVSADDDGFHPPTSDDPTWIETVWFPFWLPELGASIHTGCGSARTRASEGGTVTAWKGENRYLAHDSWSEEHDRHPPTSATSRWPDGFRLEVRRAAPLLSGDPHQRAHRRRGHLPRPDGTQPRGPGGVTGHVRRPPRATRAGAGPRPSRRPVVRRRLRQRPRPLVGAADDATGAPPGQRPRDLRRRFGLLRLRAPRPGAGRPDRITSGYWLREGRAARIVGGERRTELDGDFPVAVDDRRPRRPRPPVERSGESVATVRPSTPGNDLYAVLNLVGWDLDGATGLGREPRHLVGDRLARVGTRPLGSRR